MGAPTYGSAYPTGAFVLSLIGGIFIVLGGIATMALGAILSFFPAASAVVIGLGAIGLILGLVILFLAFRLKSDPGSAKTSGVVILVLSLISWVGGGGFFIGFLLALIGGILAIVWNPPPVVQPGWGQPGYGQPAYGQPTYGQPTYGQPAYGTAAAPMAPPLQATPQQRFCSRCGSANVASAQFCAKCGAPMA